MNLNEWNSLPTYPKGFPPVPGIIIIVDTQTAMSEEDDNPFRKMVFAICIGGITYQLFGYADVLQIEMPCSIDINDKGDLQIYGSAVENYSVFQAGPSTAHLRKKDYPKSI